MTAIFVVNKSTLVSNTDVKAMTQACATQVRMHAAPVWGLMPIPVIYTSDEKSAPRGAWVIAVLDDPDQADALGWHTEDQGDLIYGRIFARPVLTNGGAALTGTLSVSSVLSHEVLETLCDPHVCLWANDATGQMWALEVCDPVESDSYAIGTVMVSNFVSPHFFDAQARPGEMLDWQGKCAGPFEMSRGGYAVVIPPGNSQPQQVFGDEFPEWKKPLKQVDTSRGGRRVAG